MRVLDYTDFVRVNDKLVRDINGKYKSNVNTFTKPVATKNWYTKERKDLVNIMLKLKTISYKTVNEAFKAMGYSGLRPVHVELVKRYIKLNRVAAYISGKPLVENN